MQKMPTGPGSLGTGIALMLFSSLVFASLDSVGKYMVAALPVLQVVWVRYVVQTVLMTGYLTSTGGTRFLHTRRPVLQVLRGLSLLSASVLMYFSLPHIPLGDATALVFFTPVIITLMSVIFLKERIGIHRILAVLAGLAGVVLIMEPGFGATGRYHLLPLGAAFMNATYQMLTRQLSGAEESSATQFHTTATGALLLTLAVFGTGEWVVPTSTEIALFLLLGALAATGHFCLVHAFSHAPASLLAPFLYIQVLFASIYSVYWFGDALRPTMVAGTALLIASGVYIWWREQRRAG